MCGFVVGIASENGQLPDTETGVDALTHRGPDQRGTWTHPERKIQFSQCRLSVIDPNQGQQPMVRGKSSLVYNGELYNFGSLREKLEGAGYTFRTDSDTEVFLQGFREWKYDFFDRVRGMFSAAIWDESENELVLVRDHVGQKPLFYYQDKNSFLAGSELQGLLRSSRISRKGDPASLSWYLSLGYVPSPRTAFFEVKKLPPGHYMRVDGTDVKRQTRYWDPITISRNDRPPDEPIDKIRRTLSTAVQRRLVSDVPLGAFLSGGLDSSVVVSLMAEQTETSVSTVCVGFPEDAYDERHFARSVAEHFNTEHYSYEVSLTLDEVLPDLVHHFGEPFADSSAVPTYYLAKKTSSLVKVALTGDGGDETFGGYRRYRALRNFSTLKGLLPRSLLRLIQEVSTILPLPDNRRSKLGEFRRVLRVLGEDSMKQYNEMVGLGYDHVKSRLSRGGLKEPAKRGGEQWLTRWFRRLGHLRDPGQQAMIVDLMSYLPGDLMVKTDITSMMNSLECRSPFLDRDVIELSLKLPGPKKIDGNNHKAHLKEIFTERLPDEVLNRPKKGFGVPLARWFRQGRKADYLRSILTKNDPAMAPMIVDGEVKELLRKHQNNQLDAAPILWALVVLELWAEDYGVRL